MIIPVPTGTRYTGTLQVNAWIPVRCEHCGATFAYRTQRQASGRGRSVLGLDQEGAKTRARDHAVEALEWTLRRTVEPAPCPQCGNYQPAMVRVLRRRRRGLGWAIGIGALGIWFFWTLIAWTSSTRRFWATGTSAPQVLAALVAIGAVLCGYVWAAMLDPVEQARKRAPKSPQRTSLKPEEYEAISKVGYLLIKE